ncbi:MAG: twin-arginine translocase TatA/TatE family subunit [Planctomycetes bacterium]|nr:twin-arginine translocase TatA/TatE family subunit [Planctomycetota bacterium]
MNAQVVAFGMPGWPELVLIAAVGLLIFGRRLPDVARSIGKSIVEFKKGLRDVRDDLDVQSKIQSTSPPQLGKKPETTGEAARVFNEPAAPSAEVTSASKPAGPANEGSNASV